MKNHHYSCTCGACAERDPEQVKHNHLPRALTETEIIAGQKRARRDLAWQKELEERADGKPRELWVNEGDV